MKDMALKVLPILVGAALGFLLVSGPEWFRGLGQLRFLVAAALVLVFLISFVAVTISANLPADIPLTPTPEAQIGQLGGIVESYRALGFSPAGPPLTAGVSPPALMVPLVHPGGGCTQRSSARARSLPRPRSTSFPSWMEAAGG